MVRPENLEATHTNDTRHGMRVAFCAALDDVEPLTRGGRTNLSNLLTACWPCDNGNDLYARAQLGVQDQRVL
jgi:hypothetical protein